MEGQLKVNPQDLISTSSEFSSKGQTVANLTQEMLQNVASLTSRWEGDAAGAYTKKFSELSSDITRINNKIKEHVEDLQEMARTYESTESSNTEASTAMPSNLID